MANIASTFSSMFTAVTSTADTISATINTAHKGAQGLNIIADNWLNDLRRSEVINQDTRDQRLIMNSAKQEADLLAEIEALCTNETYATKFNAAFARKTKLLADFDKNKSAA